MSSYIREVPREYRMSNSFLPKIPETGTLFCHQPFLFSDFVGRAYAFLQSEQVAKMGFQYDPKRALPCKWKCSDESVFGVDLTLFAYTGQYPFDKGRIGGYFNERSLGAAVHHGEVNIDFGGSHVGYQPTGDGGEFGKIWRPLQQDFSSDCGHLCSVYQPFERIYLDACDTIMVSGRAEELVLISIPNEFLQPDWSSHSIKLTVNLEQLARSEVRYREDDPLTHTPIGRTLFYASERFLNSLNEKESKRLRSADPTPIFQSLTARYFNIYDASAKIGDDGLPVQKLLPYMKYIISSSKSPSSLKAAIVNANIEHNRLTDAVRSPWLTNYSFASFTGVFIDIFDTIIGNYVNLFQPLGIAIKPAGLTREIELTPEEINKIFTELKPVDSLMPVESVVGFKAPSSLVDKFNFSPGFYRRD
jgi:hypothetical protein